MNDRHNTDYEKLFRKACVENEKLKALFREAVNIIDQELGDTDISHYSTDRELLNCAPLQWLMKKITEALGGKGMRADANHPYIDNRDDLIVENKMLKALLQEAGEMLQHVRTEAYGRIEQDFVVDDLWLKITEVLEARG